MNEGGLFGEREGWHLPGFDTSSWTERDLSEGLPSGGAGVGFFVTTFDLDFPKNTDVLLSFQFESNNTLPYRARLFVNGWMFGKVCAQCPLCNVLDKCGICAHATSICLIACCERGPADTVPRASGHPGL